VTAVAIGLTFVPLFNLLGFEFALAMGAVLAYVSGWRAAVVATSARRSWVPGSRAPFPGQALLRSGSESLSLTLLPLAVIATNALRVPTCDWKTGLEFYALFTVPGVLYGTVFGFAAGLRWSVRRAVLAFCLWSLATYAYALWNMLREPPIFAYNAFIAFFPGPVYDAEIPLTGRIVLARGIVVLEAVLCGMAAVLAWDGRRLAVRGPLQPWTGMRGLAAAVAGIDLVVLGLLAAHADTLGLRIHARHIQRELGGAIETEHCHLYYATSAYTAEQAQELAREAEFHYAELRTFFGFAPSRKLGCYVYASGAQKKELMGAGGTSFEDALADELHVNAARYPHPVLRHEMAHLFAAHLHRWMPICPLIGLHEGIAVAAEWREESARLGLTPDEACAGMDSLGVLPDPGSILGAFGFWTAPGARAYTAAGSFVHYLVETQGMDRFRQLWWTRDFAKAYGRPLAELVAAWHRDRIEPVRLRPRQLRRAEQLYRPPAIFAVPCAHAQAELRAAAAAAAGARQFAVAESLQAALLEIEPNDSEAVLGLARAQLSGARAAAAVRALDGLLVRSSLPDPTRGLALHLRGDALWTLGRLAEAERSYAKALEFSTSRAEARALVVGTLALADSSLREGLRTYLVEPLPDATSLAVLSPLLQRYPESMLPRYLVGRRIYFVDRFREALEELDPLRSREDLPPDLRLEVVELCAQAELRRGRPEPALAILDRIADLEEVPGLDLEAADRLRLEDIRHRAEWARSLPAGIPDGGRSGSHP
jgi:tetratricopeptide (TPR) repeat protein